MPGFRDADIYPLGRPNLARARRLAGHARRHAVMYTCNRPACARVAEIVRADLRRIGIDVAIKPFALVPMFVHEFTRGAPFDIGWFGWSLDFPDPSDFLGLPFTGSDVDFPGADAQRYKARIAAASRLSGEARLRAYGQLGHRHRAERRACRRVRRHHRRRLLLGTHRLPGLPAHLRHGPRRALSPRLGARRYA